MDEREFLRKYLNSTSVKNNYDKEVMLMMLTGNAIVINYAFAPDVVINNFLRGQASETSIDHCYYNPDGKANQTKRELEQLLEFRRQEKQFLKSGNIYTDAVLYNPVTKNYANHLVMLDSIFRASKAVNTKPITLYRGTESVDKLTMDGLNSCSLNKAAASAFYGGALLQINLPANFPYIELYQIYNLLKNEKEVLLPPCNFKVIGTWKEPHPVEFFKDMLIDVVEVEIEPKNLAKEFLKRMRKPPDDYPLIYRNNPAYEFEVSKAMIDEYIKNQVSKGIIKLGGKTIKETKNPQGPQFF